jgi:F0F1-type ATP synthase assembly protein I
MADRRAAPTLIDLLQIGAVCGIAIGIGVFAGYLIDRVAGTPPLFTFVGLAVGIVGAATGSYRVIRPFVSGASDRAPDSPEQAPQQKD